MKGGGSEKEKVKTQCESGKENNFSEQDKSPCLMKDEKQPVVDEGMIGGQRKRGKEVLQKCSFYVMAISLLYLMWGALMDVSQVLCGINAALMLSARFKRLSFACN